ncbi:hypothetical protein Hanom_Chr10g00943911 [Helianthus anomalus]
MVTSPHSNPEVAGSSLARSQCPYGSGFTPQTQACWVAVCEVGSPRRLGGPWNIPPPQNFFSFEPSTIYIYRIHFLRELLRVVRTARTPASRVSFLTNFCVIVD